MKQALEQVRDGVDTFDSFALATSDRWRRLAFTLLRRWSAGSAVDIDDLTQELLIGAWLAIPRWEDGRQSLERFVVWNAMTDAKRWLHKQRGANLHGNPDKAESRFAVLALDDEPIDAEVEAAQERIVETLTRLRLACRLLRSEKSATALAAVAVTGSVDGAMTYLNDAGYSVARKTIKNALHQAVLRLEE